MSPLYPFSSSAFSSSWESILSLLPSVMLLTAIPTFVALRFLQAPYAKFSTSSLHRLWGPPIPAKISWIIQESPSFLALPVFLHYAHKDSSHLASGNAFLLSLFLFHYFFRVCVFPFLLRSPKPCPLVVLLLSFLFCLCNGPMQGFALSSSSPPLSLSDVFTSPLRVFGVVLFVIGFCLNQQSDHILRSLRKAGDGRHYIPYGGLFDYVSAANYGGEFIEWVGWSLACQTVASVAFAIYTFANLGPRAKDYHKWYLKTFENYPKHRKAMIPFIY